MPDDGKIRYFLGANSQDGFCSFQEEYLPPSRRKRVCILKGGPGTGKSAMMQKIGRRAEEAGIRCEYYACASDPASLDGVVFPDLGSAVLDGTAPHVIEPACAGAVEDYVSFSPLWDSRGIAGHREQIEEISAAARGCYTRAFRYLSAAGQLRAATLDLALGGTSTEKLARRGRALARRYIPAERRPGGRVYKRFLTGLTPEGRVSFNGTVAAQCSRVVALSDRLGLAPFVLAPVLSAAKGAGLCCIACFCPLNPKKLEHILLPELSLAFVTSTRDHPFEGQNARSIRTDHIPDAAYLEARKAQLRENERRCAALVDAAVEELGEAKTLHDRLEACYVPYMDFAGVDRLTETVAERVLH